MKRLFISNKTKIKKYTINLLLLLLSIFIVLILLEFYLRYDSIRMYDEQLGYKLKPNLATTKNNFFIKTNSDGLRDREFGEKDNNTFRILFLGDSFAFGLGAELNETFSKLLEGKLNNLSTNMKYEVVNAGVLGYNTFQEFYMFNKLKKKYNPDLVLLQFYLNDIYDNYEHANKKNYEKPIQDRMRWVKFFSSLRENFIGENELKTSKLMIGNIQRSLLSKNYQIEGEVKWKPTEKILLNFKNEVRDINRSFAIVTIPSWGQIYLNYTYAVNKSFLTAYTKNFIKEDMVNLEMYGDLDKPNKLLKSFGKQYDIIVIDPLPEFRESTLRNDDLYLLPIDDHLNAKGNQLVADVIYRELIRNHLVPDKK